MFFSNTVLVHSTILFLTASSLALDARVQLTNVIEHPRVSSQTPSAPAAAEQPTPAAAAAAAPSAPVAPAAPAAAAAPAPGSAWTAWSPWSPCSRSCGGGVSVQTRQCLPRKPSRWRRSRKRRRQPSGRARGGRSVARVPHKYPDDDCQGLSKRFHECNTAPCPGAYKEPLEEQCAAYDRRPFRGRYYTWLPYVDGNAPCVLNCRPQGQPFYASLGFVADGTACTQPGSRAICVHGTCKVVGREGVLSSPTELRDLRCGRRLVSGLFSRSRLPLGYSLVGSVPRGACRLNVTELAPSDNYIALKLTNGSFIVNGEFAVSAPGTYEAAGSRFIYVRDASLDSIFAPGPIQHPIDIMVLYTQANSNIKYEYLIDDTKHDADNDVASHHYEAKNEIAHQRHHRHHTVGHAKTLERRTDSAKRPYETDNNVIADRRFLWKILTYSQCSRSCGGGIQIGKYKCVEVTGDETKEVSPAHCAAVSPAMRRRRCGVGPCPPRWRSAPWGQCPQCGPAQRTRIVGCVQDHAKGITKISDQKCPLPMPSRSEACDIPNCDGSASTQATPTDARRQIRTQDRIEPFRGPANEVQRPAFVANASANEVAPRSPSLFEEKFSYTAAGGWLFTEWSECVGGCVGGGVQTRGVRCAEPAGCEPRLAPAAAQPCKPRALCDSREGQWFSSEWSKCSSSCGGRQARGVLCVGGSGRRLRDSACAGAKPETERGCGGTCAPTWYLSEWSECGGPCEAGVQGRTVWCARGGAAGAAGAARDGDCAGARPLARRHCVPARCTTRAAVRPAAPQAALVSESQQRVTRHQNRNVDIKERSFTDGTAACVDRLSNCALAVQARLCRYKYYSVDCCHSCHGRR